MIAAKLAKLKHGEVGNGRKVDTSNDVSTIADAAAQLNVRAPSVERAKYVLEHGSKQLSRPSSRTMPNAWRCFGGR
jgi:hypothetical protein